MNKRLPVLFGVFMIFGSAASQATDITYCKDVTPKSVEPVVASPNTAKKIVPYLGIWIGNWNFTGSSGDSNLCTSLVITKILGANKVRAQYSWGAQPSWNIEPGSRNIVGKFEDNKLILAFTSSKGATYTFLNNNRRVLKGKYTNRYGDAYTDLFKISAKSNDK